MSNPLNDAIAASGLVSAAVQASLISVLHQKGLLSEQEVREIYEEALLMIEESQAVSPLPQTVFAAARELIEEHLRPNPSP